MNIHELRTHVIECDTIEKMRLVWETLNARGERMSPGKFDYIDPGNLHILSGAWRVTNKRKATVSFWRFMGDFGFQAGFELTIAELRDRVIGGFSSPGEMKLASDRLKRLGESVTLTWPSPPCVKNRVLSYVPMLKAWLDLGPVQGTPWNLDFDNFVRLNIVDKPLLGKGDLRKHTIGPFNSLGEMREAWNLLRSIDEKTARKHFSYTGPYNLCYWDDTVGWGSASRSATIATEDLKEFISMYGVKFSKESEDET
ncbi:MAG: hypothetical protein OQK82_04610 [Candidatus Pacearchaeota archaeon]|nr:hypothetical protein [Candidatus Pacearchaeota archaeon]